MVDATQAVVVFQVGNIPLAHDNERITGVQQPPFRERSLLATGIAAGSIPRGLAGKASMTKDGMIGHYSSTFPLLPV
jgi:hypothetical protein